MNVAIGVRVKSGWAAAVVLGGSARSPQVLESLTLPLSDPSVPATTDHQYWCVYTQTCIGPDNQIVEPYVCSNPKRSCHQTAVRLHQ